MSRDTLSAADFLKRLIACLLFCAFISGGAPLATAEPTEELLLGIEPEHNIFDQMERYRALAGYLTEQLGVKVNLTIMSRYGEVIKRFKTLKLDGAFLTSYTANLGIRELDLEPIASPVNLDGESTAQGYIFVRKDSGISNVKDMRGKSFVFVDPATTEGYLFPLAYLAQHGIRDMNTFFTRFDFSGSHASAIFAVLDGRADIGAAKNTTFNTMVHNDPSIRNELHIIAESPKFPEITLCLRYEIDRDLRARLGAVLLQMDQQSQGQEVLKQFKALRFVKSNEAQFFSVEKMKLEARKTIAEHKK